MDHTVGGATAQSGLSGIVRTAFTSCDAVLPVGKLANALGNDPMALVILFVSPGADVSAVIAEAAELFSPTQVVGCTTAGELGELGYSEDTVMGLCAFCSRR